MVDLNKITVDVGKLGKVTVEVGKLFSFLTHKPVKCFFALLLPRIWFFWLLDKSIKIKIGNYVYRRLGLKFFRNL